MSTMTARKSRSFGTRPLSSAQSHRALKSVLRSRRAPHNPTVLTAPTAQEALRKPPQPSTSYNEPSANELLANVAGSEPSQIRTVSVKEAAYRLHKSPDSIYAWLRCGRLLGWQTGGPGCQIQVVESSVEEALKRMPGNRMMVAHAV